MKFVGKLKVFWLPVIELACFLTIFGCSVEETSIVVWFLRLDNVKLVLVSSSTLVVEEEAVLSWVVEVYFLRTFNPLYLPKVRLQVAQLVLKYSAMGVLSYFLDF